MVKDPSDIIRWDDDLWMFRAEVDIDILDMYGKDYTVIPYKSPYWDVFISRADKSNPAPTT